MAHTLYRTSTHLNPNPNSSCIKIQNSKTQDKNGNDAHKIRTKRTRAVEIILCRELPAAVSGNKLILHFFCAGFSIILEWFWFWVLAWLEYLNSFVLKKHNHNHYRTCSFRSYFLSYFCVFFSAGFFWPVLQLKKTSGFKPEQKTSGIKPDFLCKKPVPLRSGPVFAIPRDDPKTHIANFSNNVDKLPEIVVEINKDILCILHSPARKVAQTEY